ncbi:MAG: leucine-rich repeat domain-containing protein [Bacteroidota bacterium]
MQNFTSLKLLYLSGNQISNISSLQSLLDLETLYLSSNPSLSDITPLQNLTNLKTIFLQDCQVSDITSLQNLTALTWLSLSRNQVTNIASPAKSY